MSIIDFLKNNCSNSRTLASYYTDVHSAGFTFHINGRLTNLWEATNPNGKKEYFILDYEICWNTMCRISNNHMTFRPDPNDFVLKDADSYVDLSQIYAPAKDEKKVWVYKL